MIKIVQLILNGKAMYVDIKELKAVQAKAIAAKVGSNVIESILKDIKNAAARGDSTIKIVYKDYKINSDNLPHVCHWANICGFVIASYEEIMYIKW